MNETALEEIWKDIPWWEWKYQVSSMGRVRSLDRRMVNRSVKWRVLKPSNWQYLMVCIGMNNTKTIHSLVAKAFLEKIPWKEEINHINWVKTDNRVENLEWCTKSENKLHSIHVLWHKQFPVAEYMRLRQKPNERPVRGFNQYLSFDFESAADAERKTWINRSHIWTCAKWKSKTAGWFIWKYI